MTELEVPAGFRPTETYADAMMGLVCLTCGAVVARGEAASTHVEWHERLFQRIGQA